MSAYILPIRGKAHIQRLGKRALCGFRDASAETAALPFLPQNLCKRCQKLAAEQSEEGK